MTQSYFSTSDRVPTDEPRFVNIADITEIELTPGLNFQPMSGQRLMLNVVRFSPGVVAPTHAHEEEQLVYVLEGELMFQAGEIEQLFTAGMGVIIPPWVPHGARALDAPCLELDLFSPPRKALQEIADRL